MVLNKLNYTEINNLVVGKKYNITRKDDTKWYVGIYEKIDTTDKTDVDILISDESDNDSDTDTLSESDFDDLYVWFKNVIYEKDKMGDIGFPISKVLVYEY